MAKAIDITGQTFGRLTVLHRDGSMYDGKAAWLCQCTCGNTHRVDGKSLRSGNTTSCGCYGGGRHPKHGLYKSDLHQIWRLMRYRCNTPSCPDFHLYGGRGITVDPRWDDFKTFHEDMSPRPSPEHTLDRIDNDGPYSPKNCRWSTAKEQTANKRINRDKSGRFQKI